MPKIEIPTTIISTLFPEANNIDNLPRKKKKAMKIKIAKELLRLAEIYYRTKVLPDLTSSIN